jgi:hypothetical protein
MKTILVKLNPQNDLWMLGGKLPNVSAEAIVDTAKIAHTQITTTPVTLKPPKSP